MMMDRSWDVPKSMLHWMGIGSGRCPTILFLFILATSIVWYVVYIAVIGIHQIGYLTTAGFLATPVLVDSIWFVLYARRNALRELFDRMGTGPRRQCVPILQLAGLFLLVMVYPNLVAIVYIHKAPDHNKFYSLSFSREDLGSAGYLTLVVFSVHVTQFPKTTLTCAVSIIYSTLCNRCRKEIAMNRRELSAKEVVCLPDTLRRYRRALKTVHILEDVFSPVMLLLVTTNFLTIFTGLTVLFFAELDVFKTADVCAIVLLNLSSLLTYTAFAAEVPRAEREVHHRLCEINEDMSCHPNWGPDKPLLEAVLQRSEISLSAGSVLYFNRGFILGAVGSLFTYGVLVVQLKPLTG